AIHAVLRRTILRRELQGARGEEDIDAKGKNRVDSRPTRQRVKGKPSIRDVAFPIPGAKSHRGSPRVRCEGRQDWTPPVCHRRIFALHATAISKIVVRSL